MENVYILSAARTAIGGFNGQFAAYPAPKLGSMVIKEIFARSGLAYDDIHEVLVGNVITGGIGQAPARQAAIGAGIPPSVGAVTINKVCGSSLKAVIMGSQAIRDADAKAIIAIGQESMSQAPYILEKARSGYRMGHGQVIDSMIKDGLWDPYGNMHMGQCGELCAEKFSISREEQDQYAISSYKRAQEAQSKGIFAQEIVAVDGISQDEEPQKSNFDKFPKLKPVFKAAGTITAANASKINDGAAGVVIAGETLIREKKLKPIAKILGWAMHSQDPLWFTTAPVGALEKLFKKTGLGLNDFDLYEINEAFAVVALVCAKQLNIPLDRLNVHGGAVALGHPIGASGARILVTLLNALKTRGLKRGAASICIGGGEALALGVELV